MGPQGLRKTCLAMPGAEETFPFGLENSVFKVSNKIFALTRLDGDPLKVSLKCEPLLAEQLREAYPEIVGGYHLNKRHWNTVTLGGSAPDKLVKEMIEDSYDLIVAKLPRTTRRGLGWAPEVDASASP